MTEPAFGIIFNLRDDDPLPPVWGDFSVLGLVLPSDDANTALFPLNTPVDINTGDAGTLAALGTGPLYQAILAINSQLQDLQRSARAIVVRVATGINVDATIANIVGDPSAHTGLYALLQAPVQLGVTPRLIGAPGFTGVTKFGVTNPVVTNQGTGYTAATVAFSPAGASATVQVSGGKVTGLLLTNPGAYSTNTSPVLTISGDGTGAAATVSTVQLANPICAALPAVLEALLAHAIVGGPGTTKTDAFSWEQTMSSRKIIPTDAWTIIQDGVGTAYQDGAAAALGIGVRVDFQHGGFPFWSFANQPVQGILGVKRLDSFSLVDGATDSQELLANQIGVIVRDDRSDVSLADSGFSLISYSNASTDPLWNLFNKTRGRDFIHLALLKSIRHRLGQENITPHGVQAVINDMAAISADLVARECLIGFSVGFDASVNSPENLRAGKFRVFFDGEEPAPILQVTIDSGLDRTALVEELATLATTVSGQIAA